MTELAIMMNLKKQYDLVAKKVELLDEAMDRANERKYVDDIQAQIDAINEELQMLREEK